MLREVLLEGPAGKKFKEKHFLHVRNPAEAIRLIDANYPGLEDYLRKNSTQEYEVWVGDEIIDAKELVKNTQTGTIRIIPVMSGSSKGIGQIITGAILVAASFIPGMQWLAPIGASLMLGGVSQMLSPVPSMDETYERPGGEPNYAFNGILNTTNEGNAIPVLYGEANIGGQLIYVELVVE